MKDLILAILCPNYRRAKSFHQNKASITITSNNSPKIRKIVRAKLKKKTKKIGPIFQILGERFFFRKSMFIAIMVTTFMCKIKKFL